MCEIHVAQTTMYLLVS